METQSRRAPDAAEPLSYLDGKSDRRGLPGWLEITVLVVAIVLLVIGSMMLLGGGGHNPMQHF